MGDLRSKALTMTKPLEWTRLVGIWHHLVYLCWAAGRTEGKGGWGSPWHVEGDIEVV